MIIPSVNAIYLHHLNCYKHYFSSTLTSGINTACFKPQLFIFWDGTLTGGGAQDPYQLCLKVQGGRLAEQQLPALQGATPGKNTKTSSCHRTEYGGYLR